MTYICIYYIVYTNISKIKLIFGWPRNVLLIKNSRFLPQFFDDFKRKRVLTQRVLKYQFELVIFSSSIEVQYFGFIKVYLLIMMYHRRNVEVKSYFNFKISATILWLFSMTTFYLIFKTRLIRKMWFSNCMFKVIFHMCTLFRHISCKIQFVQTSKLPTIYAIPSKFMQK